MRLTLDLYRAEVEFDQNKRRLDELNNQKQQKPRGARNRLFVSQQAQEVRRLIVAQEKLSKQIDTVREKIAKREAGAPQPSI